MNFLVILLCILCSTICDGISCRSLRGDTTWFAMLKPPRLYNLVYADKEKPFYVHHDVDIGSWTNPIALTMMPVYVSSETQTVNGTLNYFMFNDEVPEGQVNFKMGHAKGAVLFDDASIVYIITSVPHYPYNDTAGYNFPHTGVYYGQHFFCATFPKSELTKLLYQIRMMWPFVYNYKVDQKNLQKYEDLDGIVHNKPLPAASNPSSKVEQLRMTDNTVLDAYNKNGTFGADIFSGLISTNFNPPMNLLTETWQNGKSKLPSFCSKNYSVKNVLHVKLFAEHFDYKESQDHSKWAVSADKKDHYICFGGVNRMGSQYRRGGAMYCFFNDLLWNVMRSSVVEVQDCKTKEDSILGRILKLFNIEY